MCWKDVGRNFCIVWLDWRWLESWLEGMVENIRSLWIWVCLFWERGFWYRRWFVFWFFNGFWRGIVIRIYYYSFWNCERLRWYFDCFFFFWWWDRLIVRICRCNLVRKIFRFRFFTVKVVDWRVCWNEFNCMIKCIVEWGVSLFYFLFVVRWFDEERLS